MPRKNNRYLARIVVAVILIANCVGCGGGSSSPPPPPPTPAISTISPTSAAAGGSAFTLTVSGSNFVSGSVVSWNGSNLTTTFVSSTQLTASVSAADIATAGTAPVQVTNPAPGGGSSNTINFSINNPMPALSSLSPASTVLGDAAFTLTLNGNNFVSGSTVQWNGSSRPTAFVSNTQVTAQIPAADIAAGGKAAVSVANPAPGGGASNSIPFNILFLPRFAYVTNGASNTVSILTVDATTGQLLGDGYAVAGTRPYAVAVDPSWRFVYVANQGSNDISIYTISATTGALTSEGKVAAGTFPFSVVVDPSSKFVYVANESSNNISMYTINSKTGLLTSAGTVAAGTNPESVTVDPSGRFVYVANQGSNNVSMYTIDGTTGALIPIGTGTVGAGSGANAVAVDPSGRFAYVANASSNDISMYTISTSTGVLTSMGTIGSGGVPSWIATDPTGRFLYTANYRTNDISMYTINVTSGVLTSLGTIAGGGIPGVLDNGPSWVTVDPSGNFVYATGSAVSVFYKIDSSTGVLARAGTMPVGMGPAATAVTGGNTPITRTPKFAYVANATSNNVSMYTINATTGALTSTGTITAGTGTFSIATDPLGRFAYVTNSSSNNISAYTIDATTGALTQVSGSPFAAGSNPAGLTVDPSGRFVYVSNFASNNVSAYSIDQSTGALTQIVGSPYAAANEPIAVAVDPTGRFAYVANQGGTASGTCNPSVSPCGINAYSIDPGSGALTAIAGSPFPGGPQPSSIVVDPSNRFVYVANQATNTTAEFAINTATGGLNSMGFTSPVMGAGTSIDAEPGGKFVYVTDSFNNNVAAYSIDSTSGALAAIPGSPFAAGTNPSSVVIDISGKFAYIANQMAGNVSTFSINSATGALTSTGTITAGTHPMSVATTGTIQ